MKYVWNIILILFVSNSNIIAQSSHVESNISYTIMMLPNWKIGQTYHVKVQRKTEQIIKNNHNIEGVLDAKVKIQVREIQAQHYVIDWIYEDITFYSPLPEQEILFSPKFGINKGLHIRFHLDTKGHFKKIENWQAIQEVVYNKIDNFKPQNLSETKLKELRKQYKAVYATQKQIETIFSKDIILYYGVYGQVYKLGTEKKTEVSLPNSLGGKDFPATLSVKLKDLDLSKQLGTVEVTQTTQPKINQEILYQYFKKVAENQGRLLPEKSKVPLIDLKDESLFYINTLSYDIYQAERVRTLQSCNFQKIETTKIEGLSNE